MTEVTGAPSTWPMVAGLDALQELEFGKALELVARRAVSAQGADAVRRRRPSTSLDWIENELATVAELATVERQGEGFEPAAVPELTATLKVLATEGSVLEPVALAELMRAIEAMRLVHGGLRRLEPFASRVAALRVETPPLDLSRALERALEPDGTIKEGASPELRRARNRVREVRGRLVQLLQGIARDLGSSGDDVDVTVRGGRYVIPVRRDARSRVQGLVHDESSSGATLFVEPVAAVDLGNELRAAEADEARVLLALLRQLTERARGAYDRLAAGYEMCIRADDLYARARYMVDVDAAAPTLAAAPAALRIRRGFHPIVLDEVAEAVPFDLEMAPDQRTLLVSGPNAGGKTVLLKGVALVCAFAQSGIVPPVGAGTLLPLFQRLFVDIGDHQSIAESLSTFSAHVATLKTILAQADASSLVVLDEVGGGTDPWEGAALAGAVLTALTERASLTLATTHLTQLKDLAAARSGFLNASLQFDARTLSPTYRLSVGRPGRSYGLAIARRLGLPEDVLAAAEELMPEGVRRLEAALAAVEAAEADLRRREGEVAVGRAHLQQATSAMDRDRLELRERLTQVRARERALELEGRVQARRFLLEARRRVEEALGLARAAVNEATAREARRLVEEGVEAEAEALKKLEGRGWRIRAPGEGVDRKAPPKIVPMRSTTPVSAPVASASAPSEIDLRGMTADEAEAAVVTAIDAAVIADLPWLRIIHGKGTGVLRSAVAAALARERRVASFRLAPPNQGGTGVTIAELGP